jgi:hypothetical protein
VEIALQDRILIPQPPFSAAIDPTVQHWVTGFMAVAMGLALLYALIHWRSSGKPTFLMLFLGGGAMMAFGPAGFPSTIPGWHFRPTAVRCLYGFACATSSISESVLA